MNKQSVFFITMISLLICSFATNSPKQGVVAAASPEATKAGVSILEKGGNAIDAAVAISFVLGVTEPAMSGLGGGTQILIALPGKNPFLINGSTISPALTDSTISADSLTFHKRSTIPSTVKVLYYTWKKYGSKKLSWSQLLQPAINLAKKGYTLGQFRADVYKMYEKPMLSSPYHSSLWLKNGRSIPEKGDIIVQPVLASTMERIAKYGAADFYEGEIAKAIASDMEKNGGWIRYNDLKNFPEPTELPALSVQYKNYTVYSMPPPGGGYAMLQLLKMYEKAAANNSSLSAYERWAYVLKAVHHERDINPIIDLKNYTQQINEKLSAAYLEKMYTNTFDAVEIKEKSGETTHFSVVDKKGIAVAVTASINAYFGAKSASPALGFLYNTYMDDFEFGKPGHPNGIRPGAMAYSSMCPTIVQQNGKTVLITGTPGSARIISTVAQVVSSWIHDHDIEKAVAKKRYHVSGKTFYIEEATLRDSLIKTGMKDFIIKPPSDYLLRNGLNSYFGGVHAIAFENGKWKGAADPRRDGTVGYSSN